MGRPPSASGVQNRPVDIPRPPSSAQKLRYTSKTSNNGKNKSIFLFQLNFIFQIDIANRTWHATNNDDYAYE